MIHNTKERRFIIPKLMMFITENVSSGLRGELTKWMLQLKPGVFIGTLSSLVGEKLWEKIQKKQEEGGAIWVKGANTEQRFKLFKSGNTNWSVSDFEGLQLITHPNKKLIKKRSIPKNRQEFHEQKETTKKTKKKIRSQEIPQVNWNTENTPINFVTRKVVIKSESTEMITSFSGTSAYGEYPPKNLWSLPWTEDIKNIGESLLRFLINLENLLEQPYYNKKILCIDIETTDYLPKAYEGFVNIIGIALLDLKEQRDRNLSLKLFQAFNMMRKRHEVPLLLTLISPYLKNVDIVLVFNKNFDIKIINTIINKFALKINLLTKVIDLQDFFPNLKSLEDSLTKLVGVKRNTTEKGKYSEYYQLFKGQGRTGYNKKIEPIGTYNLIDTLTPLFMYLILNTHKK